MFYLQVFIMGGLIGLTGQLIFSNFKLDIIKFLTALLCLGSLLSFLGLFGPLVGFGGAATLLSIQGAGDAIYSGILAALRGEPASIIRFCAMVGTALTICAILGSAVKVPAPSHSEGE